MWFFHAVLALRELSREYDGLSSSLKKPEPPPNDPQKHTEIAEMFAKPPETVKDL